ncbi:MAG TPA: alpha-amylase family glycosyl hydrolase [Candidatus Hydrogenedens sp.]|nr:alpha-amylase family glycosyl hydrolase [Candidatus Hydrogenedens sp.]HOL20567.1 alpha-amylase family glycosyl hydrolase [Candidatus Hydrogenedens sp.]HPP59935.1 alpha-amylase family glycosyl hydrolase [Candidatus Hydrogenedens sp.]
MEFLKSQDWYPVSFLWNRRAWEDWDPQQIFKEMEQTLSEKERKSLWIRSLVEKVNQLNSHRVDFSYWSQGELRALEIITEVFRYIIHYYGMRVKSAPFLELGDLIQEEYSEKIFDVLTKWLNEFPPEDYFRKKCQHDVFFSREPRGDSALEHLLQEVLLGWITNQNPAGKKYNVLFSDDLLKEQEPYYPKLIDKAETILTTWPPLPETRRNLWDTLWEPIRACPHSLEEQLNYIRKNWSFFLPASLLIDIDIIWGIIQEERQWRGFGKGPSDVLDFNLLKRLGYEEYEAFSPDRDWMPNLVLIAKSTYVWLSQLSRKYQRTIKHLDDIPDEELDQLAEWGFSGLWLIGVWERSEASKKIKRMTGNPEALASAYSLYDYEIAEDLGGEQALRRLQERAFQRGIRLASDMVPNHFGIYSRWIVEHPGWFIQSPYPPFPSYRFNGPNLSLHPDIGIQIEDGYWDNSDAAVVFKWQNYRTGEVRYIYHGNDGTHMPWNDTAQLNFLLSEVREAVKRNILHVARMFPIIRFDAAMTLTKRHFQRLWFPAPGEGGAIPSRAEYGMTREEFDKYFPKEFWREVVDVVAEETPDTLLLAEAFWLLEGYFVRTLGMHRVYNSAFMNMLKMEDNAKYRQTIKNVLEFSPPILQRFVNFMNNPDEETAVAQFGKGDKYFGVATMMVTLPGLPMFGHGQIEGFTEKYGMEYPRAYWDELPDEDLIRRHEREIFPLMKKRHLFSGSRNFTLYDFITPEGWVDENVFAYTNREGLERALIFYNNSYNTTRGRIYRSTPINVGSAENPELITHTLGEALGFKSEPGIFYIFHDFRKGLDYIYTGSHLCNNGIYLELQGYEYAVFLDWREVYDRDGIWGKIAEVLAGKGVYNIENLYHEFLFSDVIGPFEEVMNPELIGPLIKGEEVDRERLTRALEIFWSAVARRIQYPFPINPWVEETIDDESRKIYHRYIEFCKIEDEPEIQSYLGTRLAFYSSEQLRLSRIFTVWNLLRKLGGLALMLLGPPSYESNEISSITAQWLKEWHLTQVIAKGFSALGLDKSTAEKEAEIIRICIEHAERLTYLQRGPWAPHLYPIFSDKGVQDILGVHEYGGRTWFIKENFEDLLFALFTTLWLVRYPWSPRDREQLSACLANIHELIMASSETEYDYNWLFEALK